jgi:peptidoglycan/xylan/chitin deacetylase (PgdA/CDA1 family)
MEKFCRKRMMRIKSKFLVVLAAVALGLAWVDVGAFWPTGGARRHNKPGMLYWHGAKDQKNVALTFDDGPSVPCTSQVLDILKEHGVRATFFLVGQNVDRHPDLAKRILDEGHVIGNHTYSHRNLVRMSFKDAQREIKMGEESIARATGVRPTLFRAPFGRLTGKVLKYTQEINLSAIEWTISPRDWKRPPENIIVKRVMSQVKNGSIILLHDGRNDFDEADRIQTVEALPQLIEQLQMRGYKIVTVPEILALDTSKLAAK